MPNLTLVPPEVSPIPSLFFIKKREWTLTLAKNGKYEGADEFERVLEGHSKISVLEVALNLPPTFAKSSELWQERQIIHQKCSCI